MKGILKVILAVTVLLMLVPAVVVFMPGTGDNKSSDLINVLINGKVEKREIEEYLFGTVAGEMPASFHEEALKAQAVAARTYIVYKCGQTDAQHPQADVCTDSTHCKAYLTEDEIIKKLGSDWMEKYSDKVRGAVEDTKGIIATYDSKPIEAVFHSTSSGITENAGDVWGGEKPYLVSTESPGDLLSPNYESSVYITNENFSDMMKQNGYNASCYIGKISRNPSGSVKTIDVGGCEISGVEARNIFSLPSANFDISLSDDGFTFHCKGKGHGVGMSQYGADYYAKNGKNYEEILKIYYKGIELKKNEHINRNNKS